MSLERIIADIFGPTAVVTAAWRFQGDGADKAQTGTATLVYVRVGDRRCMAHAFFANSPRLCDQCPERWPGRLAQGPCRGRL